MGIAHFEVYNLFNNYLNKETTNDCLLRNLETIMKLMIPFTPHLANECLELLGCKSIDKWPEVKKMY